MLSSLDEYRVYYHKRVKQNFLNNTYKFVLILIRVTVTTTKLSIFLYYNWFTQPLLWHVWIGQVKMPNAAFISTLNSFPNVRNYRNGWLCHVLGFCRYIFEVLYFYQSIISISFYSSHYMTQPSRIQHCYGN